MKYEDRIKDVAKLIANDENFYRNEDQLWNEHWDWYMMYRNANSSGSASYSNQARWYGNRRSRS